MHTSTLYPELRTVYLSEVVDGGDAPIFRVSHKAARKRPWNAPDLEVEGSTKEVVFEDSSPSGVWGQVFVAINNAKKLNGMPGPYPTAVSGPEMYGFSSETVIGLCQSLWGIDEYVKAGFKLNADVPSIVWENGPFSSRSLAYTSAKTQLSQMHSLLLRDLTDSKAVRKSLVEAYEGSGASSDHVGAVFDGKRHPASLGAAMIDKYVEVFWPYDDEWYLAQVKGFDRKKSRLRSHTRSIMIPKPSSLQLIKYV